MNRFMYQEGSCTGAVHVLAAQSIRRFEHITSCKVSCSAFAFRDSVATEGCAESETLNVDFVEDPVLFDGADESTRCFF